jgi:hypothetical protein
VRAGVDRASAYSGRMLPLIPVQTSSWPLCTGLGGRNHRNTQRRRPRVKVMKGGGELGALRRVSAPCPPASHNGLWMNPVKGLGPLERVRRGLADVRGL